DRQCARWLAFGALARRWHRKRNHRSIARSTGDANVSERSVRRDQRGEPMNAPERSVLEWVDANQRLLVVEFRRLKAKLAGKDDHAADTEIEALRAVMPSPAAIDTVTPLFGLSAFEREILLLAAGAEMDSELAALCGSAAGQTTRSWASFGLALGA